MEPSDNENDNNNENDSQYPYRKDYKQACVSGIKTYDYN